VLGLGLEFGLGCPSVGQLLGDAVGELLEVLEPFFLFGGLVAGSGYTPVFAAGHLVPLHVAGIWIEEIELYIPFFGQVAIAVAYYRNGVLPLVG